MSTTCSLAALRGLHRQTIGGEKTVRCPQVSWSLIGPGDDAEPALTIMLEGEG